jgi:hypothetical protein
MARDDIRVCIRLHRPMRVLNLLKRKDLVDVGADLSIACAARDLTQDVSLKPIEGGSVRSMRKRLKAHT